jgi:hypothetical protein
MAWLYLIVAGLFEIGGPVGLNPPGGARLGIAGDRRPATGDRRPATGDRRSAAHAFSWRG